MKSFLLPFSVFITFLLTTGSPQKDVPPADNYYVLKIYDVLAGRVDSNAYFCLIKCSESDVRSLISGRFNSRRDVFDTLFDRCGAVGILDNNSSYWENFCRKDTVDFSQPATASIDNYALLSRLNADSNYRFNDLSLHGSRGFRIGISKVTHANFHQVVDPTGICAFGGRPADKVVVLRKGFTVVPG